VIIVTDSREQLPYPFERFPDVEVITQTLPAGDYSLPGFEDRVAIERKSLDDLVQCLMNGQRDRFERELQRGSHYDLFCVVVEATLHDVSRGRYRSNMNSHAALQSVLAFSVRYRVPFLWCGDRAGGEYVTHSLIEKYLQELSKRFEKATKSQRIK
jgi:DNA excision repair protein ERCC-4